MPSSLANPVKDLTTATAVKTAEILASILERIAACSPQRAYFAADEFLGWPAWVLEALLATGLFRHATRATEVFCDGCEWACLKPVERAQVSRFRCLR
jgi:hypothetical protein